MADQTVKGHPSTAARRFRAGSSSAAPGPVDDLAPAHVRQDWATSGGASSGAPRRPARGGGARRPSGSGARRSGGGARRRAPGGGGSSGGGFDEDGSYFDGADEGGQRPIFVRGTAQTQRYAVKQLRATSRVLIAEWLLALVIVVLKPSEPATELSADGAIPASEMIVPQLVGVMGTFFVLALVGSAGPRPQRFANLFGALVVLGLAFKNHGAVLSAVQGVLTPAKSATPAGAPSALGPSTSADTSGTTPPAAAAGSNATQLTQMTGTTSPAIPGVSSPGALATQNTGFTGWRGA